MAFIISKVSTYQGQKRKLYYLVENYRDKTTQKVRRRNLLKLDECKNLNELLNQTQRKVLDLTGRLEKDQKELDDLINNGKLPAVFFGPHYKLRQTLEDHLAKTKAELEALHSKIAKIEELL
jgi:hypothetical protein